MIIHNSLNLQQIINTPTLNLIHLSSRALSTRQPAPPLKCIVTLINNVRLLLHNQLGLPNLNARLTYIFNFAGKLILL
jgi:hypothetical protein